ncbi:TetR/AcrR family transcriptional regulator [Dactylosporangium sp. CS-033363]|uniref:TetR/AcrR family transcriptional regulator n=1 Tax=Dactylosporangium sp. CS-033363 TaxID=3239935 RepID=UPI003D8A9322
MATSTALSRARIVDATVALLDAEGESGLTFRALAARLRTGPGAIYWHVANKDELLAAAADAVLAGAMTDNTGKAAPEEAIRALAEAVFDAIDAHPWIGTQLPRVSSQPTTLGIFERIGRQVQALGVPAKEQFTAASALLNYILGVAGQNAANARAQEPGTSRTDVLAAASARLDPQRYPFVHTVAGQLREHDDRDQFLAGVDLVLAGIGARRA